MKPSERQEGSQISEASTVRTRPACRLCLLQRATSPSPSGNRPSLKKQLQNNSAVSCPKSAPHLYSSQLLALKRPWEGERAQMGQIPLQESAEQGSHRGESGSCRSHVKGTKTAPRQEAWWAGQATEHEVATPISITPGGRFAHKHIRM